MPVLDASNLRKTFRAKGRTVEAVKGVSLYIESGEVLAFLGQNGAGKTTTIKMVAGLIYPDEGHVRIAGMDPFHDARAQGELGAVLEGNRNIYWRLTPEENLQYFGVLRGLTNAEASSRALTLLDRFGLADKRTTPVSALSRGMQQKLAIAVALIHQPRLLLLDEPTLGLDDEAAESVKHLVREFSQEGHAILLTTHQLDVAEEISDRVMIIRGGAIIAEESTRELIRQFSGQAYSIYLDAPLDDARRTALEDIGAIVIDGRIEFMGQPDMVWRALDIVKPLPLIRVEQDEADLTEIFLKLVREAHDG
jgi:ABC-2 type transport system ATP-binding protein